MNKKVIMAIIMLVILIGVGVWYFLFYNKNTEVATNEIIPEEEISEEQMRQTIVSLYFYNDVINDFKNKSGLSLLIYFQDKFSGEVVLYDYKNDNSLELGIRLIEEMEGKNIGYKTIYFLLTYLKENIHINKIRMKCFKENIKSDKLINRLNFKFINEDETFKYYEYDLK